MDSKFNCFTPFIFTIVNFKTNDVYHFKTREEFISFLVKNVDSNIKNSEQFKKDIKTNYREDLMYKYLRDYYIRRY